MGSEPFPDLEATHLRLINWARWSRDRPAVVRCFSLEGRYRPELLRGDEEEERRHASISVDVRDALRVYRAINTAHGFPAREAFTLAAEYVFRFEPQMFGGYMRRHGFPIRHRELPTLVQAAKLMAHNAMKQQALASQDNRGYYPRNY